MAGTPYTTRSTACVSVSAQMPQDCRSSYLACADLVEGHKSKSLRQHRTRQFFFRTKQWDGNNSKQQLRDESERFDTQIACLSRVCGVQVQDSIVDREIVSVVEAGEVVQIRVFDERHAIASNRISRRKREFGLPTYALNITQFSNVKARALAVTRACLCLFISSGRVSGQLNLLRLLSVVFTPFLALSRALCSEVMIICNSWSHNSMSYNLPHLTFSN